MNKEQIQAIQAAYADLVGVYQTVIRDNNSARYWHDWKAHALSIQELEAAFPEIIEPVSLTEESDET